MYRTGIISIIVPIHNTEKYLEQCVESILQQTYTNLEVILIDDNSSDRSAEICDRFAEKDSRVMVAHVKAGSAGGARNVGLDMATGEFIGFVDSDDWIDADLYESMLERMKVTGLSCVACERELHYVNGANGFETYAQGWETYTALDAMKGLCFSTRRDLSQRIIYTGIVWDKLYRHELWDGLRFAEELRVAEDREVMFRLYQKITAVAVCKKTGYHYRCYIGISRDGKSNNEHVYQTGYQIYNWAMEHDIKDSDFPETVVCHSIGRVRATVAYNNRSRYFETANDFKKNWPNLKKVLFDCKAVFVVLSLGLRFTPHLMWTGLRAVVHFKKI